MPRSNQNRRMSSNAVPHLLVPPVEVGLLREEVVQVVLLRLVVPRPRGPAEHRHPVVRRGSIRPRVGPDVPVPMTSGRGSIARPRTTDAGRSCGSGRGRGSRGCRARRASRDQPVERREIAEVARGRPCSPRRRTPSRRSATDGSGSARSRRPRATPGGRGARSRPRGRRDRRRRSRRTTVGTAGTGRPTATTMTRSSAPRPVPSTPSLPQPPRDLDVSRLHLVAVERPRERLHHHSTGPYARPMLGPETLRSLPRASPWATMPRSPGRWRAARSGRSGGCPRRTARSR